MTRLSEDLRAAAAKVSFYAQRRELELKAEALDLAAVEAIHEGFSKETMAALNSQFASATRLIDKSGFPKRVTENEVDR